MSKDFVLAAEPRTLVGKGASRRLRREEHKIPAIIYGDDKAAENINVLHNDLLKHLEHEAFYSQIITLTMPSGSQQVILKDLQRHPAKPRILHADFLRVSKTKKLHTRVPLHFINETTCVGVKTQGGVISHNITDLEISCLAADLPEYIEVDMAEVELGKIVHISDLKLPKGVESVALAHGADHDLPVANVHKPKGGADETAAAAPTATE